MSDSTSKSSNNSARVLIISVVGIIITLGLLLAILAIARSTSSGGNEASAESVNVLENSDNECVQCHSKTTPGIVDQYGHSTMAAADVTCQDCHEVESDYPGAIAHQGTHVLNQPTTAKCQTCHSAEVAQFNNSRHGLPSYVAYAGTDGLTAEQRDIYDSIAEAQFQPDRQRNSLFKLEGPAVTRFACESCHDVGKPALDGSVGDCSKCHLRHEFSIEQVRKPETCNHCHIGPDHPQWEIYQESPHGIAYATGGDDWHWTAEAGTLTVEDFPAPTCQTCHFSGFGSSGTTHDSGDRLTWFLFAPISERRPNWQENKTRMQNVCAECHNSNFIEEFYEDGDAIVEAINDWVIESNEMMEPLKENGLLTDDPFDEPIDFEHFELWHHWGRTAKFGAWMQGPDYTQWHGAYEVLRSLSELEETIDAKLEEAGVESPNDSGE